MKNEMTDSKNLAANERKLQTDTQRQKVQPLNGETIVPDGKMNESEASNQEMPTTVPLKNPNFRN